MTVTDTNNIPKLTGDFNAILNRVAEKVGAYMETRLVAMISEGYPGWPALHPFTIQRKGSSQPGYPQYSLSRSSSKIQ